MARKPQKPQRKPTQAVAVAPAPPPVELLAVRVPEAARMIGVSRAFMWELVKAKHVKVQRLGPTMTLVIVQSLRDFLARPSPPPRQSPNSVARQHKPAA